MRSRATWLLALAALSAVALVAALPADATFRGRPGKIAFSRSAAGSVTAQGDIWIAERSGGGQRRLTRSAGIDESDPTFSPNGGLIAYVRRSEGNAGIWVMRADGSRKRPLATGTLDEVPNATFPVVSANGRWLVYSKVGDGGGIRLRNLRSGRTRRLTSGSAQELDFAPGSRRIVFTGQRRCRRGGDLRFAILSIGIREGGANVLRRSCRREFIDPAYAPNGRKLVFAHKRLAATGAGLQFRLGIMSPNGSPLGGAPRHRRGTNELFPAWQAR